MHEYDDSRFTGDPAKMSLADAIEYFLRKGTSSVWRQKSSITIGRSKLGKTKLTRLTRRSIQLWCDVRGNEVCAATVQNDLRLIRLSIEHVRRDLGLPTSDNPAMGVHVSDKNKVITVAQLEALSAALQENPIVRVMIIMAADTGLTRAALSNLQWRDVDFEHGTVHLRAWSSGPIVRTVALSPAAVQALRSLPRTGHRVFATSVDSVKWAWQAACRRVGLKGVRYWEARHVLNYEGATRGDAPNTALVSR